MSQLVGITFDEQNVSAAQDGKFRARFVRDGIISGFEVTASGDTVSVSPGMMVVAGRLMEAENTVSVQTSLQTGVARLLIDIDMTQASTSDLFEQAGISMEYASSESAFTDLENDDINDGGRYYHVVLATMTVTAGIISNLQQSTIGAQLISTYGRKTYTGTASINVEDNVLYTVENATNVSINIPDGECQAHIVVKAPTGGTPTITLLGVERYNGDSLSLVGAGDRWEFAVLDGTVIGQRWFD